MSTHVGVDWARGRWVVAELTGEEICINTEPSILNVWDSNEGADAILVDIPIGLPENGPRACDAAAREKLEHRSSSVFSVPSRGAVESMDYESAVKANEEANCGGIGSQSWGLVPQIRELDIFLQRNRDAQAHFFESHPEVCFHSFAEGRNHQSKLASEGIDTRQDVIEDVDEVVSKEVRDFISSRRLGNAKWHYRIQSGRVDDVLDAVILALTGREVGLHAGMDDADYPSLPNDRTNRDGKDLKMEIVTP